jgi:hypothetical protein
MFTVYHLFYLAENPFFGLLVEKEDLVGLNSEINGLGSGSHLDVGINDGTDGGI